MLTPHVTHLCCSFPLFCLLTGLWYGFEVVPRMQWWSGALDHVVPQSTRNSASSTISPQLGLLHDCMALRLIGEAALQVLRLLRLAGRGHRF